MEPFNILCLDGGGIRGVVPATLLLRLERWLQEMHGHGIGAHFHLLAGTSTGAILAAGLAQGMSPAALQALYVERGREIFPWKSRWSPRRLGLMLRAGLSAPKYDIEPLANLLREVLGQTPMAALEQPLLIPFYDTLGRRARFIKSYGLEGEAAAFGAVPVWEACVCSAAAPTFFPAWRLEHAGEVCSAIDGGVAANNPAACAVADALQLAEGRPIRLLSLGTGSNTRAIPWDEAREWGALEWALPVVDVLMDASLDVYQYIARQLLGDEAVLRLQFPLDPQRWGVEPLNDDMDDASPENIASLIAASERYLEENEGRIRAFLSSP